jgi:hypothetical protein
MWDRSPTPPQALRWCRRLAQAGVSYGLFSLETSMAILGKLHDSSKNGFKDLPTTVSRNQQNRPVWWHLPRQDRDFPYAPASPK